VIQGKDLMTAVKSKMHKSLILSALIYALPHFANSTSNRAIESNFDNDTMSTLLSMSLVELQTIKVSVATGSELSVAQTPSSVTLVTEAQWQAMGINSLAEVLETIPGIHVSLSQSALSSDVYSIRGLQASLNSQLIVLIDGEHLKSSTGGSTVFGFNKSLIGLKQIEIIKGPGSAIYGADSFSGVINLVTKKGPTQSDDTNNNQTIGFRLGSFNNQQAWLQLIGNFAGYSYSFTADFHGMDDDSKVVNADLQSALDKAFGTNASMAPGYIDDHLNTQDISLNISKENWHFNFWHYRNNNAGLGAGAAQALDPSGHFTNGITLAKLNYELDERLIGTADISFSMQREYIHTLYHIFPDNAVLPIGATGNIDFVTPTTFTLFTDGLLGNPSFNSRTFNLAFTHIFDANEYHKIRWQVGVSYTDRDVSETKNFGPTILNGTETLVDGTLFNVNDTPALYSIDTQEHYTFLSFQDEWQINNGLSAVVGARVDNYQSFGSTINPRVSLIYRANDKLTAKLQYGSAFRAPATDERFFRNNPVTLGNENLKAEEVNSYELSIDYQWHNNLITNLTWFQYRAKNIIEFVFAPSLNGNLAQNIGQQDGRGVEASIKWQAANQLSFELNYSYIDATDVNNIEISNIPQNQYYAAVNWKISNRWQVHARINSINDRIRPVSDTRDEIADYRMADLKIQRNNLMPGLNLALVISNLLNKKAKDPSNGIIVEDYLLTGRQVIAELSYKF